MNVWNLILGFITGLLIIGVYTILWSLVSLIKAKTEYIKAKAKYQNIQIQIASRNNGI